MNFGGSPLPDLWDWEAKSLVKASDLTEVSTSVVISLPYQIQTQHMEPEWPGILQQIQLSVDNEVERSASIFRAISGGASPQNAYGLSDSAGSLPLENAIVPSISDCASGSLP